MKAWTRRDLTIVPVTAHDRIIIACDSCGGIGVKNGDALKLSPRIAAKFTARVALTEVICSGARPVALTNGVSCEMTPTGEETILGIGDELKHAGITDIVLSGSTEENFTTSMTALAITVVGVANESELRFGKALKGDKLVLLGRPRVGREADLDSAGFYVQISQLLNLPEVKEIVPVGSKGVSYEAKTLAALSGKSYKPLDTGIDYLKSGGPATCLLILCAGSVVDRVLELYTESAIVGEIE